ncbi:glycosyltransferase family 39 protein [Limibaculum sp. M0105]|uniref:Glycosyltransferase family 39 protein n=1 Tax=Thermohalobaculum xanthum TaxID=2753746 RepID=A0A8J7M516_9RHOB|nr:glycosyltransferase family 39 protein [Thermohalobaculum xanthum]MBK0398040.1 glycosyltransferase family 39 protein [Thermohalobaculum xanthum]
MTTRAARDKRVRAASGGGTRGSASGQGKARGRRASNAGKSGAAQPVGPWRLRTFALIAALLALHLAINALALIPVHFDEAQYWAYGQELAWGYFSKPPLVGFVIRIATDLGGDTLFWLRFASPLAHALIALGIFAVGARLFDGRVGFWAAAGYSLAPGVGVSAMIMSTDPVVMVALAGGLYALVRAGETGDARWWAAVGVAFGLGMLAKYTMLAFAAGALGYGLFSARERDLRGTAIAVAVGLAVFAPNLLWNAANGFATVTHVAEDANPGRGYFNPGKLAEFTGAQLGVIGPVFFAALLLALWRLGSWRDDWRMRLLAWQCYPLLVGMIALSFVTRAQPNWAAPAYVAGSIIAARLLVDAGWWRGLKAQLAIGAAALVAVVGLALAYATMPLDLPRFADPFKKMRMSEPFCALALGAMAEEGAQVLLSNDRRRLSECMFEGGLTWDDIAVWNPLLNPQNHHELVATLRPGDSRSMLLAIHGGAENIVSAFDEAYEIDAGTFPTHSDREAPYQLWFLQGFRGYAAP